MISIIAQKVMCELTFYLALRRLLPATAGIMSDASSNWVSVSSNNESFNSCRWEPSQILLRKEFLYVRLENVIVWVLQGDIKFLYAYIKVKSF